MSVPHDNRPPKRRKLVEGLPEEELAPAEQHNQDSRQAGLDRPISPPFASHRPLGAPSSVIVPTWGSDNVPKKPDPSALSDIRQETTDERAVIGKDGRKYVSSPFQLTHISGMNSHQNVDAVKLGDILGDPLIKECWNFNFLFDIDFVMKHFDADIRDLVKVKIVHGFWKNNDERRIALMQAAERYPNIQLLHAYIPDPFGTHHSKMLVLFTHDDYAQVIISTANMIPKDWGNMTQAVWRSPRLPLLSSAIEKDIVNATSHPIGSGERFKIDLLRYFGAYGKRMDDLTGQLRDYDFSAVTAAFIGSAPSRQKPPEANPSEQTSFGWLGLQEILGNVPIASKRKAAAPPHIVMQVSSIATLGAAPTWLTHFQSVLARTAAVPKEKTASAKKSDFFSKRQISTANQHKQPPPKFNIIFPTANEIRASLDGYGSGASIHMKLQSPQQQKQLEYLHPLFCHWTPPPTTPTSQQHGHALRGPAAPHIKTYMRFTDETHTTIDWALLTSANLSKQAWGDVPNKKNEIWIQSWEAGVVVWPQLFADSAHDGKEGIMIPAFGSDSPVQNVEDENLDDDYDGNQTVVVALRMPYDLPLISYTSRDEPWCATLGYDEVDCLGKSWDGY